MPVRQLIELGEQSVQQGYHLGRRPRVGEGGEADDVREQHGHHVEAVGDDVGPVLEALGDRGRQDVQQQTFGSALFHPQCVQDALAFANEVPQEQVHGGGHAEQVEHKKGDHDRRRDMALTVEAGFEGTGRDGRHHEGDEPRCRSAYAPEQQRTQRCSHGPQLDGARRAKAAQAGLQKERQCQDHGELARPERSEPSRVGERQ